MTTSILNCVFSFLTLQPNSTVSFITISFKYTLAESPVSLLSRRKKKQNLSILINIIISIKRLKKVFTLLKIKVQLLLITPERVPTV